MRRIAFINEKGGTGKTTLAVNVAAYFAQRKGLTTLLVDLDTQGHAGKSLGIDVRSVKPNAFHFLCERGVRLEEVMQPTMVPKLFLVPSYKQMSEFPTVMGTDARRARRLSDKLEAANLAGFDVILFDSPPSMGLTTLNILLASTEVVIPVAVTYLALDGCAEIVETARRAAEEHGQAELSISLVVPTLYRHTVLAEEILEKLRSYFPGKLAKTSLAFNVKIDEAQSHGKTIWEYAPSSRGAQMLAAIAEEVLTAQPPTPERSVRLPGASAGYRAPEELADNRP
jgi:chromosome partitioning protein